MNASIWLAGLLVLTVTATKTGYAQDLQKVEDWMYATCIQQNFFMSEGSALDSACRCYAAEVTPFLAPEFQRFTVNQMPYNGTKPISDVTFGIVMMARALPRRR